MNRSKLPPRGAAARMEVPESPPPAQAAVRRQKRKEGANPAVPGSTPDAGPSGPDSAVPLQSPAREWQRRPAQVTDGLLEAQVGTPLHRHEELDGYPIPGSPEVPPGPDSTPRMLHLPWPSLRDNDRYDASLMHYDTCQPVYGNPNTRQLTRLPINWIGAAIRFRRLGGLISSIQLASRRGIICFVSEGPVPGYLPLTTYPFSMFISVPFHFNECLGEKLTRLQEPQAPCTHQSVYFNLREAAPGEYHAHSITGPRGAAVLHYIPERHVQSNTGWYAPGAGCLGHSPSHTLTSATALATGMLTGPCATCLHLCSGARTTAPA